MQQQATILATGMRVTIVDFESETINYPKKTVVTSKFWVHNDSNTGVFNYQKNVWFFTKEELEFEPKEQPTHNISNGEERFLQAQHEASIENRDYNQAAFEANFK